MTYENNKTIILTILVITSVILTWSLWTYQPNYATMEKSNFVQDVALSEKKEVGKIVQPEKVIYHFDNSHFGTNSNEEIVRIIQELESWKFYDLEDISGEVKSLPDFAHAKGNVEIIFPDVIPMALYKKVINIEDKKTPDFFFNRIVIDVGNNTKEDGKVYFIEYGNPKSHKVVSSHIKHSDIRKFYSDFYSVSMNLPRYFAYKLTEDRKIFLPENRINITSYKYFLEQLNPEKFKTALFSDPSVVQKTVSTNNVEYSDATSMMTVNNESKILEYINPVVESNQWENGDLLQKAIDYVNEHGGWTGLYKYESLDRYNQKVTFRLYDSSGIPIFNSSGLSEVVQIWGKIEIYKYIRPILALNVPLRTETTDVTLISGREVLDFIESKKGFEPELLENLVIGFEMERDQIEPQLVNLHPYWFYRYNGKWNRITEEDLGGLKRGLE